MLLSMLAALAAVPAVQSDGERVAPAQFAALRTCYAQRWARPAADLRALRVACEPRERAFRQVIMSRPYPVSITAQRRAVITMRREFAVEQWMFELRDVITDAKPIAVRR